MDHPELASLLRRRVEVIADHELRASDPEAQLAALKEVSEAIERYHRSHQSEFDPRLQHFMSGCSFEKALRYLDSGGSWAGH